MTEALLEKAFRIFCTFRTLPLDIAANLMSEGYIIEELEAKWRAYTDKNHIVCYGWTDEAEAKYADR